MFSTALIAVMMTSLFTLFILQLPLDFAIDGLQIEVISNIIKGTRINSNGGDFNKWQNIIIRHMRI